MEAKASIGKEAVVTRINPERWVFVIFWVGIVVWLLCVHRQDIKGSCLYLDPSQSQNDLD